jgi:RNA polymerase sigma factor (sigma-70 family)
MRYEIATDEQLLCIAESDHECPSSLLEGVALEMIKRKLWDGIIIFAAKQVFRNVEFVLKQRLFMDWQELIHIGHIQIMKKVHTFKTGMRTFKTFVIMILKGKFMHMLRDCQAEMRYANIGTVDMAGLDEKIQDKIFHSPVNVERTVINRMMLEEGFRVLREVEKQAILLEQLGYEQYEISTMLGFKNKTYANCLINRAYAKLRKQMGA